MEGAAQGVLDFVAQVAALQTRVDAGEEALAASSRSLAALDAALALAEEEATQARRRLRERVAESAKHAAKLADFLAVLSAQEASSPSPLERSRAERAARLASLRASVDDERAAFLARCAAFQKLHDPSALHLRESHALARLKETALETQARQRDVRELQESASAARAGCRALAEQSQRTLASCAALCDSRAMEAHTASTLCAELAALSSLPAAAAAAKAGAAACVSREEARSLEDACAAQRMELTSLRDESAKAQERIAAQMRELAMLKQRPRGNSSRGQPFATPRTFTPQPPWRAPPPPPAMRSVTRALTYNPAQATLILSTVQTDTHVTYSGGHHGVFTTATSVVQRQQQQQQQQRMEAPAGAPQRLALMPPVPRSDVLPAPVFESPEDGAAEASRRRRREPLEFHEEEGGGGGTGGAIALPVFQAPAPLPKAPLAPAKRVKTTYGSAKKPQLSKAAPQAGVEDPWGGRTYGGA